MADAPLTILADAHGALGRSGWGAMWVKGGETVDEWKLRLL
jgi:hypothetical protein